MEDPNLTQHAPYTDSHTWIHINTHIKLKRLYSFNSSGSMLIYKFMMKWQLKCGVGGPSIYVLVSLVK